MRDIFIVHHMANVINSWLAGVAEKAPMAPLDAVRKNILLFSQDGGNTTYLQNFCGHFLELIRELEKTPDEASGLALSPLPTSINFTNAGLGALEKPPVS